MTSGAKGRGMAGLYACQLGAEEGRSRGLHSGRSLKLGFVG